jgi:hypothetical protein
MLHASCLPVSFARLVLALIIIGSTAPAPAPAAANTSAPLRFPPGFMRSIEDYGANGSDTLDDTAAIQRALDDGRVDANGIMLYPSPDDYNGRPKLLYFPAGTYLVNDTIKWRGCCVTLQGQGSGHTIFKLRDGASGFGDPAKPKAVIYTEGGNESFRQNIWNLGIDTGSNNGGAVGINYIGNNTASMRDVAITSGDGAGFAGIAMDRLGPGPCLIKDVRVDGFNYGIYVTPGEYGPTFENITLTNQKVAGVYNKYGTLSIRKLNSTNRVPAITSEHAVGLITLLDSSLTGGGNTVSAIETVGQLYARNITTSGYRSAIRDKNVVVPGASVNEYFSRSYRLFEDSPQRSLGLPIKETPSYHDPDLANWAQFTPRWYGDTAPLQALFAAGKPTVYFTATTHFAFNEAVVNVPPSVKRIVGFGAVVNSDARGTNGGGIKFVVAEGSPDPLIIEGFGYGIKVEHKAARPLVLKDGNYRYTDGPGASELLLENVIIGPLKLRHVQNVWARQLNSEFQPIKVDNTSANLWILGFKTEGSEVTIRTANNAKTELLGAYIMGIHVDTPAEEQIPAFVIENADASLVYRMQGYANDKTYRLLIRETRGDTTRQFKLDEIPREVALFTGYRASSPVATPTPIATPAPTPIPIAPGSKLVFLPSLTR